MLLGNFFVVLRVQDHMYLAGPSISYSALCSLRLWADVSADGSGLPRDRCRLHPPSGLCALLELSPDGAGAAGIVVVAVLAEAAFVSDVVSVYVPAFSNAVGLPLAVVAVQLSAGDRELVRWRGVGAGL